MAGGIPLGGGGGGLGTQSAGPYIGFEGLGFHCVGLRGKGFRVEGLRV